MKVKSAQGEFTSAFRCFLIFAFSIWKQWTARTNEI